MTDETLLADIREAASGDEPQLVRASRVAQLIREQSGYRWVGVYRVTADEIQNLAWSGPGAPAHRSFPVDRGLSGVAVATKQAVVSNDVSSDDRYLTNQDSTGSELIVPVVVGDAVVGTLDVEDGRIGAFDADGQHRFERIAAELASIFR
jgi:L-methionine (R)-S-oxide reductase